jgi:hypothetical protein
LHGRFYQDRVEHFLKLCVQVALTLPVLKAAALYFRLTEKELDDAINHPEEQKWILASKILPVQRLEEQPLSIYTWTKKPFPPDYKRSEDMPWTVNEGTSTILMPEEEETLRDLVATDASLAEDLMRMGSETFLRERFDIIENPLEWQQKRLAEARLKGIDENLDW